MAIPVIEELRNQTGAVEVTRKTKTTLNLVGPKKGGVVSRLKKLGLSILARAMEET